MVLARRIGSTEAILSVVALVVIVLGLMSTWQALFLDAPYPISITDFGRDLLGARAAQVGVNPYQTVGELSLALPDWPVQPEAADLWVAHSPLSLALARGWLTVIGSELAESIADFVQGISLVILLGWVWIFGNRTGSGWHGLLLASATALTLGFRLDAFWIQGASFLAMGVALVLLLDQNGRRNIALLILGVLVAWRPWVAPLALFLPGSRSSVKDGAQVALIATIATVLVLPWVGGWEAMTAWVSSALPENLDYYVVHGSNLSFTGSVLPVGIASVLYLAAGVLVASQRTRWPNESWPLLGAVVILTFTPLIWPHYWLALIAVVIWLAKERSFHWALLVLLVTAWPLTEPPGVTSKMMSFLGVLLLAAGLSTRLIPGGASQTIRSQGSPSGSE
ncbi:MAG TPA: hypothetical protein VJA46_00095 [Acidimicrobiia bacterium]|nr:hypothetical protein [Acidimicrobiia bacterium]